MRFRINPKSIFTGAFLKAALIFLISSALYAVLANASPRQIVTLNGIWQCEPGDNKPASWKHSVVVPGLVDLIKPEMDWKKEKYFWYKRTVILDSKDKREKAYVKIDLSKYGTEVYFNGKKIGYYNGCYTSSEYDVSDIIKYGTENEIIIRVGSRDALKRKGAVGGDHEKANYIPGVWGDVNLILTGSVNVKHVKIIPDIDSQKITAKAALRNKSKSPKKVSISSRIKEKVSGKIVSKDVTVSVNLNPGMEKEVDTVIEMQDMKLWSCESPFMYELETETRVNGGLEDIVLNSFGMRKFEISGSDFYLNNKRVFLRGSNIAFHRFLSDKTRQGLVWDKDWIKKALIDIPKEHNFNYFRNHLGQMYNSWYDIADEYGMLIQNEWIFWIFTGTEAEIKEEFTVWLTDNFNHPSIIMWDALNEPNEGDKDAEIIKSKVIPYLKKFDPTRPWEYADFTEEHPYIYSLGPVLNNRKFGFSRSLDEIENSNEPTLLNEFLWYWLDTKGNISPLTNRVHPRWLGFGDKKPEERLAHQAFLASELVELFRRMRVDGIAPFVYLSIDGHATANWFLDDIKDLKVKPVMASLKDAFAPFGVSVELWDRHFFTGEKRNINVYVFNDETQIKKGRLHAEVIDENGKVKFADAKDVEVGASGMKIIKTEFVFPPKPGKYYVRATLSHLNGKTSAVSKKAAYVFDKVKAPSGISGKRIVAFDNQGEVSSYLSSNGINVKKLKDVKLKNSDLLLLCEGALSDGMYKERFSEIKAFVENGGAMIILEPSYGVKESAKINLPGENIIEITKRESKGEGGYSSYVFKAPDAENSPLWDGIDDEHLKMFNGAFGGEMVSDYQVSIHKPLLKNIKYDFLAPNPVKAKCWLGLEDIAVSDIKAGQGVIVMSRIQLRGRLIKPEEPVTLYSRKIDPVAQRYLLNLVKICFDKERLVKEIDEKMRMFKESTKKVHCSSEESALMAESAVDGDKGTRWGSGFSDPQWIMVNLGEEKTISRIKIHWEAAYGKEYQVMVSNDIENWNTVYHEKNGDGGTDEIKFTPQKARYVCIYGIQRGTGWGYSIFEIEIK